MRHGGLMAVVILASGCVVGAIGAVAGSGNAKQESREVPEFTSVEVGSAIHATIRVGPKALIVLEGDDNLLPLITTEVRAGRLVVRTEGGVNLKPSRPIKVEITTPALVGVAGAGASELDVVAAPAERFAIGASGAAEVAVHEVDAQALTIDASGATRVTLAGKAKSVTLDVSGASHLKADGLTAELVQVDVSGASHVEVGATASVKGDVSGASHLRVVGSPAVRELDTSGASHVSYEAAATPR
jgi:hypothetical protein